MSRRTFSRLTASAVAGACSVPQAALGDTAGVRGFVRLGAPVFLKTDDPEELARSHRDSGYRAAYCPNLKVTETDRIAATVNAFQAHDVVIAEVGRWVNLLEADAVKRKENLTTVTEGLALAEAVGARCCVDIAGSFNPTSWFGPHPDNLSSRFFDAAVENARSIIDAVKPKRTTFCYEMMGWSIPDSADSYLKLLRAVDRKTFAVHLDPCNLVNSPSRFYRNAELINECYDKLGQWIVSCHAKDLAWEIEMNIHFREVVPGRGKIDYRTFLRRHKDLPHQPPLMIEHLSSAAEYAEAAQFIVSEGKAIGASFGA